MYVYAAAQTQRSTRRTLGLVPSSSFQMRSNGSTAPRSTMVRFVPKPPVAKPPMPGPMPQYVPPKPAVPPKRPPIVPVVEKPPVTTPPASSANPVPATYPKNQFYVNTADGTVWEYSGVSGKWVNTGVPFNVSAPAPTRVTTTTSTAADGSPSTPVNVSVAPTSAAPNSASASYQQVLDWLPQQTLVSGIPNWGVVAASAAVFVWLKNSNEGGRR